MNTRTVVFLAGVLVLAFALHAQSQSNINLLPNPGFEIVKGDWADTWEKRFEPASGTITLDDQVKRSGKYSVRLQFNTNAGPKASGYIEIGNTPSPRYVPGVTYTFSTYVKTKNLGNTAYIFAIQNPPPVPVEYRHSVKLGKGTNDWTRLSLTFTARKDITTVVFLCGAWCIPGKLQGEVWLDDCKVEEGSVPTDYTDTWKTELYLMGPKPSEFRLPFDFQPGLDYVTPCVAPSLAPNAPKIPVLFVLSWTALRDVVELAQRAGIQPATAAIAYGGTQQIHYECAKQLRAQLNRNPKVLVINQNIWELLISEDREAIEGRVRQGMGLVFYRGYAPGKRVKELLDKSTVVTNLPGEAVPTLQVRQLEQGVITIIGEPHSGYNTFARERDYDRAVRAIYAAAGRPMGTLKLTTVPEVLLAGESWKLMAKSTNAAPVRLRARVRPIIRSNRETMPTLAIPILQEVTIPFTGETEVKIAGLPAGGYFIEASILDKDERIPAWQLLPVVADGPVRIWSATADDPVLRPGKETPVKVLLENNSGAEQSVVLRSSLMDTEDRLLVSPESLTISLASGRTERLLKLGASHSATPMVCLTLELESKDIPLDRRSVELSAEPLLREQDFRFVVYADFYRGCHDIGADTAVASGGQQWGMRAYPWIDIMPVGADAHYDLKADDVVTSPVTIQKSSKGLTDTLRRNLPFRTVGIMLQDEWSHRFSPCPENLAYFKEFLRRSYGTVAALNRSWSTNLKSFDDVSFDLCATAPIRDMDASPVPWADLQTAMEHAVADFVAALQKAAAEVDPDVRIGLSGTQEPTATGGLDYYLLMNTFKSMACYGGVNVLFIESFRQPGTRIYQWSYASESTLGRARHDPWRDLFHQRDGYLHFGSGYTPIFMPDYRPFPVAATFGEEIEAMRRGPARLISGSRRESFGIAILFSMASYHASHLSAIRRTGADFMNDVLFSTEAALADARLDAKFVSCEQLAKGQVTTKNYRVLMLPYAQALSAAEVNAIRQFAKSGGVVIADVRPGIYDEHCRKLPTGSLDDMFGIGPVGGGFAMVAGLLQPGTNYGPLPEAAVLMGESNLCPVGAVAQGQVVAKDKTAPALLVNPVGKGKAILLNFLFSTYNKYRAGGVGGEVGIEQRAKEAFAIRDLLGKLLEKEAQIAPFARLLAPDNTAMRGVRMFVYRDDPATYIGLLPEYTWVEETRPIIDGKLALAQPGELYDVRRGEYLGKTGSAVIKVQETYAKLYAVLPYRVEALELKAPHATQVGKGISFTVRLKVAGGRPGRHVIVARLQRPDGTERRWDRMTFDAPGGVGEWVIPLALNDPTGDWKLIVQDAASGARGEATVRVESTR